MAEERIDGVNGAVITFFSTASSVGKTLVSINMAAELAREGYRICLVDLDLQFGDISNYLKLAPEKTIADVQRAMAGQTVSMHDFLTPFAYDGTAMQVLVAPRLLEDAYHIDAEAVKIMIHQLQTEFDYVVIDTTSMFSVLNLAMLDLSTVVIFLGIVDFIPTIKNMKIGIDTLKTLNYDRNKLRIVLNRSDSKTLISLEDVEDLLGDTFYHILPNDFRAAGKSIKSGVPLVLDEDETRLGNAMRELVYRATNQDYIEENPGEQGRSWLNRIFGGKE